MLLKCDSAHGDAEGAFAAGSSDGSSSSSNRGHNANSTTATTAGGEDTAASLASLHARVKAARAVVRRCECQWNALMSQVAVIQQEMEAATIEDYSNRELRGKTRLARFSPKANWWWRIRVRPLLYLVASIFATICSVLVLWSEVTFFYENPTLSVYALFIEGAGVSGQYANLELITFLTLAYLSICTYRVLFRLRFLS